MLFALTVLDAQLLRASGRRRLGALAVHIGRLFTIPLSPSCRAIVPIETRFLALAVLDALLFGVRTPPLLCALAVHIGRLLYRSRHRAGRSFKSRRALSADGVLDALVLWRQAAAAAVLSPSTSDVDYTALAIV